jgi:negative regulator of sigma E activity
MTEKQDKISYLLDEYSGDKQSRAVLDEVENDVNLQYKMRRFQMIGQVMRHELPRQINTDFSANVMAQIGQIEIASNVSDGSDAGIENRQSIWTWSFMKPFAGMAVAASVALVSITLWQSSSVDINSEQATEQIVSSDQLSVDQQKIERLASQSILTNAVPVSSSLGNGLRWKIDNNAPALQQKLNAYLVNHTEYSNSMQGLIPQARVAGFDAQK